MNQTIAIVDASVGETPAERNLTRSLDAETTVYKVSDGHLPPVPAGGDWRYDGVVISGSQTSVYDDHGWIHDLTSWVRDVHRADVPTLGICWGHQFLAQSLGGRVVDMGEHELGYRTVHRRGEDPLFADMSPSFTAFQTHSDRVAELPAGAVELARNQYSIQAFRLGTRYGVQFHPEYDRETAEWVIGNKDLTDDRREAVTATITDESVAAAREATTVFENFLGLVATHQRRPGRLD
ncbi:MULTISPECIES: type 1 glutamine amidotransferase [Haloarcula]|uniref:type 1 glutamine amidotransferase n=1 Tax=Haloarcula TaxID=2237 RepID=UPI000F8EA1BC|nr:MULTISPECIES: type 1 glutamine amidotransferase [Haloarcula]NHX41763.1 type 1 glutamine amidotransferase [Haloarcula sp. R1-2]